MQSCRIVDLPCENFIGGSTETFIFEVYDENGDPVDVTGSTCIWSLSDYTSRNDAPVVVIQATMIDYLGDPFPYRFEVTIAEADTISLEGKYLQQIKITDVTGQTFIPSQGFLIIRKNTNPFVASRYWYNNISTLYVDNVQPIMVKMGDMVKLNVKYVDSISSISMMAPTDDLTFTSTNPLIANVNNKGQVFGQTIGTTTINIVVAANPSKATSAQIQVF